MGYRAHATASQSGESTCQRQCKYDSVRNQSTTWSLQPSKCKAGLEDGQWLRAFAALAEDVP